MLHALTALATVTRQVTLLPLVACTSFRNAALLAKIADSLDEVSGDGCWALVPAGTGEYRAYGYPLWPARRPGSSAGSSYPLLRGESVTFEGQYYAVSDCALVPRGPRPGGPPIWIGARKPRMLGLVMKYADAYNADLLLDLQDTKAAEDLFRIAEDACREGPAATATLLKTSAARSGWRRR